MFNSIRLAFLYIMILFISTACTVGSTQLATATEVRKEPTATVTPSQMPTTTQTAGSWQELDLHYAHVLDITYEILESTQVRFDVTLVHDDDGESPQYADWWQVENLSGNILGKRILTHGHGTNPFTRSATIEVPPDIESVIIRGHDMLHGFGGQILQLNMLTGEKSIRVNYP